MTHDSTLTRHPSIKPTGRGIAIGALHPAYTGARSIFPTRIFDPSEVKRVLKDGHQNRKIGREVRKGKRRGWPIFTLTLEERATCPRSCQAWSFCMGNGMQAAERIVAGADLEAALERELCALQAAHKSGFMIRLHVLGDFYSTDYVRFWTSALDRFPALHVFGFTARLPGTPIGDALLPLIDERWDRFAIRFSGLDSPEKASLVHAFSGSAHPDSVKSIQCPAQDDKVAGCAECALCWGSTRTIGFRRH